MCVCWKIKFNRKNMLISHFFMDLRCALQRHLKDDLCYGNIHRLLSFDLFLFRRKVWHWPRYWSFWALLLGQSLPCMLKLMLVRMQRLFRGWTGRTLSLMLRKICEGWFWLSSRMECICRDDARAHICSAA